MDVSWLPTTTKYPGNITFPGVSFCPGYSFNPSLRFARIWNGVKGTTHALRTYYAQLSLLGIAAKLFRNLVWYIKLVDFLDEELYVEVGVDSLG